VSSSAVNPAAASRLTPDMSRTVSRSGRTSRWRCNCGADPKVDLPGHGDHRRRGVHPDDADQQRTHGFHLSDGAWEMAALRDRRAFYTQFSAPANGERATMEVSEALRARLPVASRL
jgi:hypothetical protein